MVASYLAHILSQGQIQSVFEHLHETAALPKTLLTYLAARNRRGWPGWPTASENTLRHFRDIYRANSSRILIQCDTNKDMYVG